MRETAETACGADQVSCETAACFESLRSCSAPQNSPEGRQGAPLLEHRGKPPGVRRSDSAAACAVSGGDQRRTGAAWCRTIEAFDEGGQQARQIALFPEDRAAPALNCDVVHVRLSGLRLHRPRQWGACWLACHVWDQLRLDDFWSPRSCLAGQPAGAPCRGRCSRRPLAATTSQFSAGACRSSGNSAICRPVDRPRRTLRSSGTTRRAGHR